MEKIRKANEELGAFCRFMFQLFLGEPSEETLMPGYTQGDMFCTLMAAAAYVENDDTYNYEKMVADCCYTRFQMFTDKIDEIDEITADDTDNTGKIDSLKD